MGSPREASKKKRSQESEARVSFCPMCVYVIFHFSKEQIQMRTFLIILIFLSGRCARRAPYQLSSHCALMRDPRTADRSQLAHRALHACLATPFRMPSTPPCKTSTGMATYCNESARSACARSVRAVGVNRAHRSRSCRSWSDAAAASAGARTRSSCGCTSGASKRENSKLVW